jgi:hypothetical protein
MGLGRTVSLMALGAALVATTSARVAAGIAAEPAVSMRLAPAISMEPGAVRITTYVAPNAQNRILHVSAESDDHFTSSDVSLDGDNSPRATLIWLKNLPAGQYVVKVVLGTANGGTKTISNAFRVVGSRTADNDH